MTEQDKPTTQGQELTISAANSALEHTVASYLIGVGAVLQTVAQAARALADDGLSLNMFADLLEEKDIQFSDDDELG